MIKDPVFLTAPIGIFRNFQINPKETLSEFINTGIILYAKRIKADQKEVLRQLIYAYYHNADSLSEEMISKIQEMFYETDALYDFDYKGFNDGKSFNVDETINQLWPVYSNNIDFIEVSTLHYQLEQTKKLLKLDFDTEDMMSDYKVICEKINSFETFFGKDAMVSLTVKMLVDFLNNNKSKHELDLFIAFVAIKSIQGNKEFCKTNKDFIKMRMLGAKSKKVFTEAIKLNENEVFFKAIDNRYQMDKILKDLEKFRFIQARMAYGRSIYLSTILGYDLLPISMANAIKTKEVDKKRQSALEAFKRLITD